MTDFFFLLVLVVATTMGHFFGGMMVLLELSLLSVSVLSELLSGLDPSFLMARRIVAIR